jgi:SlyX protein
MEVRMKDVAERVDELEARFSFQENMIQELSGVIFSQQKELGALQTEVKTLRSRMKDFEHSASEGSPEKPPHY